MIGPPVVRLAQEGAQEQGILHRVLYRHGHGTHTGPAAKPFADGLAEVAVLLRESQFDRGVAAAQTTENLQAVGEGVHIRPDDVGAASHKRLGIHTANDNRLGLVVGVRRQHLHPRLDFRPDAFFAGELPQFARGSVFAHAFAPATGLLCPVYLDRNIPPGSAFGRYDLRDPARQSGPKLQVLGSGQELPRLHCLALLHLDVSQSPAPLGQRVSKLPRRNRCVGPSEPGLLETHRDPAVDPQRAGPSPFVGAKALFSAG